MDREADEGNANVISGNFGGRAPGAKGSEIAGTLRDRVQGVAESRSEAMMAMKQLITPLLLAVRNARELCGDERIGINLGIDRKGADIRFVGEMRVPEFHFGTESRPVVPYEVRVMVDMLGHPLVVVESCSYSTKPEFRRDGPDPVVAINKTVRWEAVYDDGMTTSVNDLARAVTASATIHAAAKERHADAAYPQR